MPKYLYVCPNCAHPYEEIRVENEPQYFTRCNSCKAADYVEVTND